MAIYIWKRHSEATNHTMTPNAQSFEVQERERLVRIYRSLTGDPDTAEDLAQEAIIEAWRNKHKLHDPSGRWRWLSNIARKVYLRWSRDRARDYRRMEIVGQDLSNRLELMEDPELSIELEREELATILDEALRHLPAETRSILLQHVVEGMPQADIARKLGISEGAVAVRIHRGKLLLRKILLSRPDYVGIYNIGASPSSWQPTDIWCPFCGLDKLQGKLDPATDTFMMKCPTCTPSPDDQLINGSNIGIARSYTTLNGALNKLMKEACEYYGQGLRTRRTQCLSCGTTIPLWIELAPDSECPIKTSMHFITTICQHCHEESRSLLAGHALSLPQGRAFWKANKRIRMLPEQNVEREGRKAAVTAFESVSRSAKYEVVYALDNYDILLINNR